MRWSSAVGLAALVLALGGCKSAAPNAVVNAAIGSAIALTASGVSRASGGCYASCAFGTYCDEVTGTCKALPCGGQCAAYERCDQTGPADRCVAKKGPDLEIRSPVGPPPARPESPPPLVAPPDPQGEQ